jgi:hypothetical protein
MELVSQVAELAGRDRGVFLAGERTHERGLKCPGRDGALFSGSPRLVLTADRLNKESLGSRLKPAHPSVVAGAAHSLHSHRERLTLPRLTSLALVTKDSLARQVLAHPLREDMLDGERASAAKDAPSRRAHTPAELSLVALRAVDRYLVIDREPRRPAVIVLSRDAAALDTLQAVRPAPCARGSRCQPRVNVPVKVSVKRSPTGKTQKSPWPRSRA